MVLVGSPKHLKVFAQPTWEKWSEVRLQKGGCVTSATGLSGPKAWTFHSDVLSPQHPRHLYPLLHTLLLQGLEAGLGRAEWLI